MPHTCIGWWRSCTKWMRKRSASVSLEVGVRPASWSVKLVMALTTQKSFTQSRS